MGCRSFLQGWKDENGVEVNSGRMNLGVVTVNLPRIALESEGDMNKVLGNIQRTYEYRRRCSSLSCGKEPRKPLQLMHQFFINMEPSDVALVREESVDELFKNRRATVSLGYIGLYEVATSILWQQLGNQSRS